VTLEDPDWWNVCESCARLLELRNPDYTEGDDLKDYLISFCTAFPDGIPSDIIHRGFDHRSPYPGDQGILWHQSDDGKSHVGLAMYEQHVPPEKRTWDVTNGAREHAAEIQRLWQRRLKVLEKLVDAEPRVPVQDVGEPVIRRFNDGLSMLDLSTEPVEDPEWAGAKRRTSRWEPVDLAALVQWEQSAREFILYVDGRTPLLPVRNLREADLGLLRAARRASTEGVDTTSLLRVLRDSTVYAPAEPALDHPAPAEVFTSALALGSRLGHVPWRPVAGAEFLDSLPPGTELALDEGRPHAARLP
jgi:hypothetical protein